MRILASRFLLAASGAALLGSSEYVTVDDAASLRAGAELQAMRSFAQVTPQVAGLGGNHFTQRGNHKNLWVD